MKPFPLILVIASAMLALSGEPPKPVVASPIDRSAEVASLKAELETLRAELAQAKSVRTDVTVGKSPAPVVLPTNSAAGGGAVCANGSCGAASRERGIFRGERRPVRRVFAKRPRLFGRR